MAIPGWLAWRQEADDLVAEGEAVPMLEETVADEGTVPLSILRHTPRETRHDSHVQA